jgi:hypothetical protein
MLQLTGEVPTIISFLRRIASPLTGAFRFSAWNALYKHTT